MQVTSAGHRLAGEPRGLAGRGIVGVGLDDAGRAEHGQGGGQAEVEGADGADEGG